MWPLHGSLWVASEAGLNRRTPKESASEEQQSVPQNTGKEGTSFPTYFIVLIGSDVTLFLCTRCICVSYFCPACLVYVFMYAQGPVCMVC